MHPSLTKDTISPMVPSTPTEASDPYTITSDEPGRDDTGPSDIMTSHSPSLKTHSPFPKNTDINGKEYTITAGAPQTHRLEALG